MSSIAAATLEPVEGPAPVSWSNLFVKLTIPSSWRELTAQSDCSFPVCSRLTKNVLVNLLSSLVNRLINSLLSILLFSAGNIVMMLASWPALESGPYTCVNDDFPPRNGNRHTLLFLPHVDGQLLFTVHKVSQCTTQAAIRCT